MNVPYKHHVFVCTQRRPQDRAYCADQGADEVLEELARQVRLQHLEDHVEVTSAGCLGLCGRGPNVIVYPDGTWYSRVLPTDVEELVREHLGEGRPVERLVAGDPEELRRQIAAQKARNLEREAAQQEAGVLPERLRRLAGDFQASRAFLTAVELDLFTAVGDGETSAEETAEQMGADPRATRMLMDALAAIGLLHKAGELYHNIPDTGRFLRRGLPDDARAALMNRVHMWDDWSHLTERVREGSPLGIDRERGPSSTHAYIAATHRIATLAAPTIVEALKLGEVSRVLDVGGGSGAYTAAVLHAYPGATAVIMDLPSVVRIAARYIREAGLEERVELRAGDFIVDSLGQGFDLVLMSYVTHLIGPAANRRLLARAFDATVPGGCIVINDYVLEANRTRPTAGALYSLNMLVSSHSGSVHSLDEYEAWLTGAGFIDVRKVELVGPTDVLLATRPQLG